MLIPTHDESIVIMRHIKEFPETLIIPYDNAEKLIMLSNKSEATALAERVGVPIPEVYDNVDEVTSFPVVLKTVLGNSAKGVFFPKSKSELADLALNYAKNDYLLEEFIAGTDYSVDCVRWNGFWQSSVYHALVTKTDGGGTTTQREIVSMPQLELYAKNMLDEVDFKGVCGMDFRYDSVTGKTAFIEINARFTGGLATPIAAGFDIPWILYSLAIDGKFEDSIDIKIGAKTKWILGDLITLAGRLFNFRFSAAEMKQVFRFSGFDAFDDFRKDDKRAILGEMNYYLTKLIKNRKLNP